MGWPSRLALGLVLLAGAVEAEAPDRSIRPVARPETMAAAAPVAKATVVPKPMARPEGLGLAPASAAAKVGVAVVDAPHPRPRPEGLVAVSVAEKPVAKVAVDPRLIGKRPMPRPAGIAAVQLAAAAVAPEPAPEPAPAPQATPKKPKKTKKGSVCGHADIRGEVMAPITSKTRGCGVEEPVKVTSIDGVQFSQPAIIDCPTALALEEWIKKGMRPAFGNRKVVGLHIFGSYMCRTRNNVRGAKISEHGHGKAVDVAGFVFADGREWTVEHDYNKTIRKAQKAACGIFGTTLGPGSDGYHEDHLHFDTADYSYGPYCR